jgi:alcohol dehydrogenase YqhD (iron-dependent ADH family)
MNFANPEISAAEGINRFRNFLTSIGMPTTFNDLGAKEDDIPALVKHLGVTEEKTVGGFMKLGPKDVEAVYRMAL